jgi:glycosyltransferase involved in cell wall biosynthesis
MDVLLDLRWMVLGRAGGLEQMAYELVAALAKVSRQDTFYLYCPDRVFQDWLFKSDSNMALIDSDRFALVPERVSYDRSEGRPSGNQERLGVVSLDGSEHPSRTINVDLVHSIGGYVHDELLDYRNILTIHDLQHIHLPHHFDEAEIATRNARYLTSIHASEAVISVSDFVKRDIVAQYGVKPETVTSIWNIPSGSPTNRLSKSKEDRILGKMGIDFEYLFFPSHGWPHKNHLKLVEAFPFIRESLPNLRMIFTGGKFDQEHPAAKKIRSLGLEEYILHIGYRTPTEIRCLYQGAKALVYPSLFEGFGMPVAEAIESGVPVVCSDIEPLVEIGGEAVVTFDPRSSKDIAEKVVAALRDDRLLEDLRVKGEAQLKRFSSEAIARQTYELYRKTCGLEPTPMGSRHGDKTNNRCESTRHWGRVSERNFRAGKSFSGLAALLLAAMKSPPLARSIWKSVRTKDASIRSFSGRYGDGWVGPNYREWFWVPEGSKRLVLEIEAPPLPHADDFHFRVVVQGIEAGDFRFTGKSSLRIPIDLKESAEELVQLEIDSNYWFRPNDRDSNGDERELAIKLTGICWR